MLKRNKPFGCENRLPNVASYRVARSVPAASSALLAKSRRMFLGVFFIAALVGTNAHAQGKPAGVIEKIEDAKGHFGVARISRAGMDERRAVSGEYVYAGDTIRVPGADATVTISRKIGPLVICPKGARQEECSANIDGRESLLDTAKAFTASAHKLVSWYGTANTVNLNTRSGNAPQIKIGAKVTQRIVAGERSLWVPWVNGDLPATVRLSQSGRLLAEARIENARQIEFKGLKLVAGPMAVEVTDAQNRKTSLTLDVVASAPPAPNFADSAPTKALERYFAASWLATQGDGAWLFEAAQQLTPLAAELQPAQLLRLAIADGEKVK